MKKIISPAGAVICALLVLTGALAATAAGTSAPPFNPHPLSAGGAAVSAQSAAPAARAVPEGPRSLNPYQRERLERFLAGTAAREDTLSIIAIQVQFSDSLMGGQEGSAREELRDSLFFANELAHVAQYFAGASRGRLTIRWEVTGKIYDLPERMGYYGDDALQDTRAIELMASVIDSSDADIDFSRYGSVMLIHAGAGQETDVADNSRTQLWSSFYSRTDIDAAFPDSTVTGLPTDDMLGGEPFFVDNFMLVPESSSQDDYTIGSLGIWVFEVGSRVGLLPLSDSTPPGRPDSRGASSFDLMALGLYNGHVVVDEFSRPVLYPGFVPGFPCVFNRLIAGWIDPLEVDQDGAYSLHDLNHAAPGDTACIKIPINESEYYLLVNRVHDSNFDSLFTFGDLDDDFWPDNEDSMEGAEFDFWLTVLTDPFEVRPDPDFGGAARVYVDTGTGMYIWHIDETVIWQALMTGHLPNDFVSRKGTDLEEADGVQDLDGLGDPFSFGSHFDSFRAGNNTRFGPETRPGTDANSGARTGIVVDEISEIGEWMTCAIGFEPPFEERRTSWSAGADHQAPSLINLGGDAALEIVVFSDTADVYAFAADGSEYVDGDGDPGTIAPFITAPGAVWLGPPAFGDIDGDGFPEIVACDGGGALYAWNTDGSEVRDGDDDPLTTGILYRGEALATPPMLVDVNDDGIFEIMFIERVGLALQARFVDGEGVLNRPSGADFSIVWGTPAPQAQFASPLAWGALGDRWSQTEGVAFAWADTVTGEAGFAYLPLRAPESSFPLTPELFKWTPAGDPPAAFPAASSIAVGDFDGNGFDEAVFTIPDGRLAVFNRMSPPFSAAEAAMTPPQPPPYPLRLIELRSAHPSAPAIADVDGDGTLEIVLQDDDYFYLFEHNGELATNWPQPLRETSLGDYPDLRFDLSLVSPLAGDVDGDGRADLLFPRGDGALVAFTPGGGRLAGLARPVPAGVEATPSIGDLHGNGSLSLVVLGETNPFIAIDAVADTAVWSTPVLSMSIQTLPGAEPAGAGGWLAYQRDLTRQGRWVREAPPQTSGAVFEPGSFKIYPNPVRGGEVRARLIINSAATVALEIYNLEGERVYSASLWANPGGVIHTPFDEIIDVSRFKSGVYMLRLLVTTPNGTESMVGRFAILR